MHLQLYIYIHYTPTCQHLCEYAFESIEFRVQNCIFFRQLPNCFFHVDFRCLYIFILYILFIIVSDGDSFSTTSLTSLGLNEMLHLIIYVFYTCTSYDLQKYTIISQLSRIEYIHHCKLIHRDLKPENISIGRPRQTLPFKESAEDTIYLIDFGMAKPYIDKNTKNHIMYNTEVGVFGTYQFMSANSHLGIGKNFTRR